MERNHCKAQCDDVYMYEDENVRDENNNIYRRLAEKDERIRSAVEVGNLLMNENHGLKMHFEMVREEYSQKVEALEQDRHNLQRELNSRGILYQSQMEEWKQDIFDLRTQVDIINKSSKRQKDNVQTSRQELSYQNNYLVCELDKVKWCNHELNRKVNLLKDRLEKNTMKHRQETAQSNLFQESKPTGGKNEVETLTKLVTELNEDSQNLKQSLKQFTRDGKISSMKDTSHLKHQMQVCQEELNAARRKNKHVNDELKTYLLTEKPVSDEMEFSLTEVDMDMYNNHQVHNDKYKIQKLDEDVVAGYMGVNKNAHDINTEFPQVVPKLLHHLADLRNSRKKHEDIDTGSCREMYSPTRSNNFIFEMENVKSGMLLARDIVKENGEKSQEDEINKMQRERDIFLKNKDKEEKLKMALEERDNALRRETEMKANYADALDKLNELNNQLMTSVQQKFELSKQVEEWQGDMDSLICERLCSSKNKRSHQGKIITMSSL